MNFQHVKTSGDRMSQQTIPVNPALLQWARMEAGLSLQEAAERAKITPPRQKKGEERLLPEDRLASWEQGTEAPSLNQLKQIAKAYHRPLLTFFLSEPPAQAEQPADFRTIPKHAFTKDTPEFSALKRRVIILHRELKALADADGSPELPFVGSYSPYSGVTGLISAIRKELRVKPEDQFRQQNENTLLGYLRDRAHDAGIYVVFMGDLGSYHSRIEPEEFRGMALADSVVPLIVINKNDAKPAMLFTLIHELAHIWLGTSAISNTNGLGTNPVSNAVEKLCNATAAEFLVPKDQIRAAWEGPGESLQQTVDELAGKFKVSGAVIGRRLLDARLIHGREYDELLSFYQKRWDSLKSQAKARRGGPSPNMLAGYALGKKTLTAFMQAVDNDRITLQDASRVLNIPVSRFGKVMQ